MMMVKTIIASLLTTGVIFVTFFGQIFIILALFRNEFTIGAAMSLALIISISLGIGFIEWISKHI